MRLADSVIGVPLGDLKVLEPLKVGDADLVKGDAPAVESPASVTTVKSPTAIQFVRNRMLYARPVLNSRGAVKFGLRHIRKCPEIRCF